MNAQTIIHADDFGITQKQSYSILSCSNECGGSGPLNSTSVLVGSTHIDKCAELIMPFAKANKIRVGLHINLVEGPCCANKSLVQDLVDENGMFSLSFSQLLSKGRKACSRKKKSHFYKQVYAEVSAQLEKYFELFPFEQRCLRVDSHQHTLLIPTIMQATLDAIKNSGAKLEYMRIPAEPMTPYITSHKNWKNYPPINFVKNSLLNALWMSSKKIVEESFQMSAADFMEKYSATFYGLILSGKMECACTNEMIDKFKKHSSLPKMEILFHPGGCANINECLNPSAKDFTTFYLSSHRQAEMRALQNMKLT